LECVKFPIDALPFSEHLQISVDVKLFVHQNYLNFLKPIFSGVLVTRSLVLYVCFVDRCLAFCTFFFGRCVVCSSIYGFWLLLYYLCTTELPQLFIKPVFSRVHVTRSLVLYVCFVDHCLPFCTFFFGRCVVCSSIYGFWLPLWYLQTLLILSEHLSSTPVFAGFVVLDRSFSVDHCFCFSFGHCVFCPIYGFWLLFGIFKLFLSLLKPLKF
jgi:hypothetical protein